MKVANNQKENPDRNGGLDDAASLRKVTNQNLLLLTETTNRWTLHQDIMKKHGWVGRAITRFTSANLTAPTAAVICTQSNCLRLFSPRLTAVYPGRSSP
jgi:hypothetical protein